MDLLKTRKKYFAKEQSLGNSEKLKSIVNLICWRSSHKRRPVLFFFKGCLAHYIRTRILVFSFIIYPQKLHCKQVPIAWRIKAKLLGIVSKPLYDMAPAWPSGHISPVISYVVFVPAVLVLSSFSHLSHSLRSVHTHTHPWLFLERSRLPPHHLANFYFSFKTQSVTYWKSFLIPIG